MGVFFSCLDIGEEVVAVKLDNGVVACYRPVALAAFGLGVLRSQAYRLGSYWPSLSFDKVGIAGVVAIVGLGCYGYGIEEISPCPK